MNESHEGANEHTGENQPVQRFEQMLKNNEFYFFDVEEFEDLIDHYMEAGNPAQALKAVEMGCEQHPSSSSLLLYKAQILASTHKAHKALEVLNEVENIEPNNIDVLLIKGTVYSQLREYRKAIDCYRMAIPMASSMEKEDIYLSMAFEFENLDEYNLSIKYLRKVLDLNPENETALYEIGFCYEIEDHFAEGVDFFKAFINDFPYSHAAWYNMGLLYSKQNLYEKAIDCFDYTLVIKEDFASAWFNKANCFHKMGDFVQAIEAYKMTIDIDDSDGTTFFQIAQCFEELDRLNDALNYYHKSISSDPYFADAFLNLGFLYEELGRLNEGIHYIKKAMELDPRQTDYLLAYGNLQIRMGFFTEAFQAFEEIIKLQEDHKEVWSMYTHGLYMSGDKVNAYKLVRKAIELYPNNALNYYIFAAMNFKEGRRNEGMEELENGLCVDESQSPKFFVFNEDAENDLEVLELIAKYNKK